MNELQNIFFENIENQTHGIYKKKAFFHSIQVSAICQKIAQEKCLDIEMAGIMGLFHDYSQFIRHNSFEHAHYSAMMTQEILEHYHYSKEKIEIIVHAISHHSDKERIDDEYSEILKDADVLAQYLSEPDAAFKESYIKRIKKYFQ